MFVIRERLYAHPVFQNTVFYGVIVPTLEVRTDVMMTGI